MPDKLPENLPGIDIDIAVKRSGGREALVIEFFSDFYQEYQGILEILKDAVRNRDLPRIQRIAHTIKGLAGNIGASQLMDEARTLEQAAKKNSMDETQGQLPLFEKSMEEVLTSLADFLSRAPNQESDGVSEDDRESTPETVRALLLELDEMLIKGDFDAIEQFGRIKGQLSGCDDQGLINKLDQDISHFEFESARQPLRQLIDHLKFGT